MFTGEPLPAGVSTMNAYLGARPIATALAAGADIVVTGRCVDAAVVLGPLMHEFGWSDDDHDLLAAGTLAGHIVEWRPAVRRRHLHRLVERARLGRHGLPDRRVRGGRHRDDHESAGHRRPRQPGDGRRADPLRDRRPRRLRDAGGDLRLARG